jgi:hypothetical protein
MKKTRIISAFPASGKTHLYESGFDGTVIIDSDSSRFSWLLDENDNQTKERNPEFPSNYMEHIRSQIGLVDYILVSSHIDVRKALDESDFAWSFVFPDKSLMLEWVGRCYVRGNNKQFIDCLIANWDKWLSNPHDHDPIGVSWLRSGEYLADHMRFIETLIYN